MDSKYSRSTRGILRLLLSGSLMKNQTSSLSRSFFFSSLRETHLLPIIASYIIGKDTKEEERNDPIRGPLDNNLGTIGDIVFAFFKKVNEREVSVYPAFNNHLTAFIPLLSNPKVIIIHGPSSSRDPFYIKFDISSWVDINSSVLSSLTFLCVCIPSLSPLSRLRLPVLKFLEFGTVERRTELNSCRGFTSLEGLTKENTRSLNELTIRNHDLVDISSLSSCDLSSLKWFLLESKSLSNIYPLQQCVLSSVTSLSLVHSAISDLSPLRHCSLSSLTFLNLSGSSISDLSPLQSLPPLKSLWLDDTKVVDLSPLEGCDLSCLSVFRCCRTGVLDLAPLTRCDLSSVETLSMVRTPVSDLSPLCDCVGFSPAFIDFSNCSNIEDISPLSRLDYSGSYHTTIRLTSTNVLELSHLSHITTGNIVVDVFETPASDSFSSLGILDSPVMIGRVTVQWKY